jgi:hypothetical protein
VSLPVEGVEQGGADHLRIGGQVIEPRPECVLAGPARELGLARGGKRPSFLMANTDPFGVQHLLKLGRS